MTRELWVVEYRTILLACLAIAGWGAFAWQRVETERRTPIVRSWAESAYENGRYCEAGKRYEDGTEAARLRTESACKFNKDFSADAVVRAHQGAWLARYVPAKEGE